MLEYSPELLFEKERQVSPEVVEQLALMTDAVLKSAGYSEKFIGSQDSFTFTYEGGATHGLEICSIPEGRAGPGISSLDPTADNSKRWEVFINRGTSSGGAFDSFGTVYEHGLFTPDTFYQFIVYAGSLEQLLSNFEGKTVSIEPIHPADEQLGNTVVRGIQESVDQGLAEKFAQLSDEALVAGFAGDFDTLEYTVQPGTFGERNNTLLLMRALVGVEIPYLTPDFAPNHKHLRAYLAEMQRRIAAAA